MTYPTIHPRLHRLLDALEAELIDASDAELAEVLAELGFKPEMKGSGAWADVLYRWPPFMHVIPDEAERPREAGPIQPDQPRE